MFLCASVPVPTPLGLNRNMTYVLTRWGRQQQFGANDSGVAPVIRKRRVISVPATTDADAVAATAAAAAANAAAAAAAAGEGSWRSNKLKKMMSESRLPTFVFQLQSRFLRREATYLFVVGLEFHERCTCLRPGKHGSPLDTHKRQRSRGPVGDVIVFPVLRFDSIQKSEIEMPRHDFRIPSRTPSSCE